MEKKHAGIKAQQCSAEQSRAGQHSVVQKARHTGPATVYGIATESARQAPVPKAMPRLTDSPARHSACMAVDPFRHLPVNLGQKV